MNEIQEAQFVANEMLPTGHYQGRLTAGVAQHLSRRLPSVILPPSLTLDVRVDANDNENQGNPFATFVQALGKKPRLQELKWQSPLSLKCLATLVDAFAPSQLSSLHVHVDDNDIPMYDNNATSQELSNLFGRLASLATTELHISLGSSCNDLEPLLQGLAEARKSMPHHAPRISLSLLYQNDCTWNRIARQLQGHHSVRDLTVQGGVWGPGAWPGLVACLQTSSLRSLTLARVVFADKPVTATMIHALQQALYTTKLQKWHFLDIQGTGRGHSLALVQTLLASMVSHDHLDHIHHSHQALPGTQFCCALQSLTLKTHLSDVLEDDYLCGIHASLAQHLPRMIYLRTLYTRWHPTTSALLWQAVQANQSLTWVDSGKAVGRMLEPVLQRNRLLKTTRHFGQSAQTLDHTLEFATRHGLTIRCDNATTWETITSSAAFWLVRTCLPPNIHTCTAKAGVAVWDSGINATEDMIWDNTPNILQERQDNIMDAVMLQ